MKRSLIFICLLILSLVWLSYTALAANNKFQLIVAPNSLNGQILINSVPVAGGTHTYECNPMCPTITLSVSPSFGKEFIQWSGGSCNGTEPNCTLVMDRDRIVSAAFGTIVVPPTPTCPTPGSHVMVVTTGMTATSFGPEVYNPTPDQVYAFEFVTKPTGQIDGGMWLFQIMDSTYSGGTLVMSACAGDTEPSFNVSGLCKMSYNTADGITYTVGTTNPNQCILQAETKYYLNVIKRNASGVPTCSVLGDNCRFRVETIN